MLPNFGNPTLALLSGFIESLSVEERSALVTLSRSQVFPFDSDTVLLSKCRPILDKLVVIRPYEDYRYQSLTEIGEILYTMITTSYLCGLVITLAMGATIPETVAAEIRTSSLNKEILATQTRRLPGAWDWDSIIRGLYNPGDMIHPLFPELSALQRRFSFNLRNFRHRFGKGKIIRPHYTTKGVSRETGEWILNRRHGRNCHYGNPATFHKQLDASNVTSRDVVHHYVRTGRWPVGRVEMRQRWYPSFLKPRTYFAWGGDAIRSSTFLREFFNQVGDCFEPTERHNRVRPNWLRTRSRTGLSRFFFYDLTSFTSWFHEQEPFLRALASYFADCQVFLISENITLTMASVGALIDQYVENVNSFPEFYISSGLSHGMVEAHLGMVHQCAGFLGVPGNLVTCTIPHGLAQAEGYTDIHELQVPGDDVGCETPTEERLLDKKACAESLGILQYEKVYTSDQASIYLKRGVRIVLGGVTLADMLIYPLFPYLRSPDTHPDNIDHRFRPISSPDIIPRACRVLVTFHRDLWKLTHGDLPAEHEAFILDFLRELHNHIGLPLSGVLQGRYVVEGGEEEGLLNDVSIKFPVDSRYLRNDPDLLFAAEEVEVMIVRDVDPDEVMTEFHADIPTGDYITVYQKRGWSFLEDMGYLQKVENRGGTKVVLIGEEAKEAYISHRPPRVSRYRVTSDISLSQLSALELIPGNEGVSFVGADLAARPLDFPDITPLRSYTLSRHRYIDLDRPQYVDPEILDYGPDSQSDLWRQSETVLDY